MRGGLKVTSLGLAGLPVVVYASWIMPYVATLCQDNRILPLRHLCYMLAVSFHE